jgi:hypothetical protein
VSVLPIDRPRALPTWAQRRSAHADLFLDALEEIVGRHRGAGSRPDLDPELVTAEVARQLAKARAALRSAPRLPAGPVVDGGEAR